MLSTSETKVYLAAPWFTNEQSSRERKIADKLSAMEFDVFCPRLQKKSNDMLDDDAQNEVFKSNIEKIEECDVIFVVTDGKDVGTIWEAGFAFGLKHEREQISHLKLPIVVYYCETLKEGDKFNLMLAKSGDIIITEYKALDALPKLLNDVSQGKAMPSYAGNVE